jgi:hypothetical protein
MSKNPGKLPALCSEAEVSREPPLTWVTYSGTKRPIFRSLISP